MGKTPFFVLFVDATLRKNKVNRLSFDQGFFAKN